MLKERAVDMISRMPEEKLYYVVQFLESVEGLGGHVSKGVKVPEQREQEDLQRFRRRNDAEIDHKPELAKGVKHFKEEEGSQKIMCDAVEKYVEEKVAVERSLMAKIVTALAADKDDDTIIGELNCTLEQIIPFRTALGK